MIALLVIARQKNADRMFAIQLARDQVAADTDTGKGGAVNVPPPAVTPASATPAVSAVVTPSSGIQLTSSSASTTTTSSINGAPVVSPTASVGGMGGSYGATNLELAVKAVNSLAKAIDTDIFTIEQEVENIGVGVSESQGADLKEYCATVEERVKGEFARAGEKLARLDLNKQTNILDTLDDTTETQLARVRVILAKIRRARSTSSLSNQSSVSSSSTAANNQNFRPYMEKLKPPVFSGQVEDWPEFRSVWRDMLSNHPESIQVQYIKSNIPTNDARRIAGVKTMEEVWKRLEKVYGDTQLNIVTVKTNLENLAQGRGELQEGVGGI